MLFLFPNTLDILDSLLFECALALLGVVHSLVNTEATEGLAVVSEVGMVAQGVRSWTTDAFGFMMQKGMALEGKVVLG